MNEKCVLGVRLRETIFFIESFFVLRKVNSRLIHDDIKLGRRKDGHRWVLSGRCGFFFRFGWN